MILGLSGWARSGKDAAADYLVNKYGFTRVAFADPIREALYRLDPYIRLNRHEYVSLKQYVDLSGWDFLKENSQDVRRLLQRLGTEVGREMIHPDIWVKMAMKKAKNLDRVVIADVRHVNEASAIRRNKGKLVRITRPRVGPVNLHSSETALDDYNFDFHITNDGFLEDLHGSIDKIVAELGLN